MISFGRLSYDFADLGFRNRFFLLISGLLALLSPSLRGEAEWQEELSGEAPYFWIANVENGADLLPLKDSDTRIEIMGTLAKVTVTQVYANIGNRPIEATYVFPGSTKAAVHGLEMRISDRIVKANIERKAAARQIYENAKHEGKTASLLEQERPNVFKMSLANILPGDVVEVTLIYSEWLRQEKGEFEFVYPAVVGPRYGTGENWVSNPYLAEDENGAISHSLTLHLEAGMILEGVASPTHDVSIDYVDDASAKIEMVGDAHESGNRDFILRYRVSGDKLKSGLLLSESNGEKYFMAMLQPPRSVERSRLPREYFFIVDVSGSMRGFPLGTAKQVMEELVLKLEETDRFNLMLFAGESAILSEEPLRASEENLLDALHFLDQAHGSGGTELLPALLNAYRSPRDPSYSRSFVILTDGFVQVEEEAFEIVRNRLNDANVFAIGIGTGVNRHLVEGLADVGQGEPFFALKPQDSLSVAKRFSDYIRSPVLSQIQVEFEDFEVYDVEPPTLPDLLASRPVYLFGKWRGATDGKIRISGRSGESNYVESIDVQDGSSLTSSRVLEYVWTRQRVKRLSDYNRLWANSERIEEVTQLGLKHSLLTNYTSFVAVDEVVRVADDANAQKVVQPLPLTKGVTEHAIGGGMSVPVTPEPEMWALMVCVLGSLGWMLWGSRL